MRGLHPGSSCVMSRRQRCAKIADRSRPGFPSQAAASSCWGTGATPAATAAAAAVTLAGVAASAGHMTSARAEMLQEAAGSAAASLAPCPGSSARTSKPYQFVDVGGTLFFTGRRRGPRQGALEVGRDQGGHRPRQGHQPRRQDRLQPASLTAMFGGMLFTAIGGTHGQELWRRDGSKAGTVLVKDIRPPVLARHGPAH